MSLHYLVKKSLTFFIGYSIYSGEEGSNIVSTCCHIIVDCKVYESLFVGRVWLTACFAGVQSAEPLNQLWTLVGRFSNVIIIFDDTVSSLFTYICVFLWSAVYGVVFVINCFNLFCIFYCRILRYLFFAVIRRYVRLFYNVTWCICWKWEMIWLP